MLVDRETKKADYHAGIREITQLDDGGCRIYHIFGRATQGLGGEPGSIEDISNIEQRRWGNGDCDIEFGYI